MSTKRWDDDRLDRLAAIVENNVRNTIQVDMERAELTQECTINQRLKITTVTKKLNFS